MCGSDEFPCQDCLIFISVSVASGFLHPLLTFPTLIVLEKWPNHTFALIASGTSLARIDTQRSFSFISIFYISVFLSLYMDPLSDVSDAHQKTAETCGCLKAHILIMFSIKMVPANSNQAKLQRLAKAAPKAAMTALNNTGFVIRPQMKAYVQTKFKNPTPAFYNSILFQKATPQKPDEAYLYVGNRSDPAADKRLSLIAMRQEKGSTANPSNYGRKFWTIPTKNLTGYRNKYGGLRGGTIKKLKGQKKVFAGTINGTLGIWKRERKLGKKPRGGGRRGARINDTLTLLVLFKKKASYHPVYKFGVHAAKLAAAEFPKQMRAAMAKLGVGR